MALILKNYVAHMLPVCSSAYAFSGRRSRRLVILPTEGSLYSLVVLSEACPNRGSLDYGGKTYAKQAEPRNDRCL